MNKNGWIVPFSLLLICTLGCSFLGKAFKPKRIAISTTAPDLPAPPKPSVVKKGTPEEQAIYFADLLASPDTRLAGWLGIYDALGVPVIDQDGKPLGRTGDDPIGPRYWQVWYASGLDKAGRGIPLSDAARLLALGTTDVDGASLGQALLGDLKLAAKSNDPQLRLLAMFIRERIKRWPSHLDIQTDVNPEEAIIDFPSLEMLSWIVTRATLLQAAAAKGKTTGAIERSAAYSQGMFQAGTASAQKPCSEMIGSSDSTYWTNWLLNKVGGGGVQLPGMSKGFAGLIEKLQQRAKVSEGMIEKTSASISKLNMMTALLSFLMQLAAMEIEPSQDPSPMERTQNTRRGKDGTIILQLFSEPGKIPDGNELSACLGSFALNALGVSFSFPAKGPISGAEITVEGGEGFPNLVLFNTEGTNSMRRWTSSNGFVEYKLFGAPQKKDLPNTVKPVDKDFSVHVKAQPEEVNGNTILNIFFGGLTFGTAPSSAGGFGSAIDIAKTFKYDMGEYFFSITDWSTKGYRATGQNGSVTYSGVICDLDKPFTVTANHPIQTYTLNFAPSSATAGTMSFKVQASMMMWEGSGSYNIVGVDTDKPQIICETRSTNRSPVGTTSGGGRATINLVPLETDECK